jgi:RNA polymerase sigma-70 factor (ECF subfamily)
MEDPLNAFRAHAPAAVGELPAAEVERALTGLIARGAAAWPSVRLESEKIAVQAALSLSAAIRGAELPAALEALHAGDLHLAAACAAGSPAALTAFERTFLSAEAVRGALLRIDPSPAFADEVRQAVREKLFIGASARIAQYSGRWPLAGWLRTIAVRTAIDLRRSRGAGPAEGEPDGAAQLAATGSPELLYLKEHYGAAFQEAVAESFETLDDEQCNLLRLQVIDGLRTAQIASLFRVDRSTIKRRLAACREQVLEGTRQRLRARLRLPGVEFESLAGLLQSQLDVSLSRLLDRK